MISQHQIRFKSILVSLGELVLDSLVEGAYPAIENSCHSLARPLGFRPFSDASTETSLALAVTSAKRFCVPAELWPCGHDAECA